MKNLTDFPLFAENQVTLQKASEDTSKGMPVWMVSSQLNVIDFDKVKTGYTSSLGLRNRAAASVDAVYEHDGKVIFVEFKNGDEKKGNNRNINDKIRDSLLIYCDITKSTITDTRQNTIFVLVLNDRRIKEKAKISMYLAEKAGGEESDFRKYKGIYFSDVCIVAAQEFEEQFC